MIMIRTAVVQMVSQNTIDRVTFPHIDRVDV
jgi:hypothetical protein